MCVSEQSARVELVDVRKIVSNLWAVTVGTRKLPELFDRLQGLFTSEERSNLNWMQDDHLKCFLLYGKFIREHKNNVESQALLLKALRATDNSSIADRIRQTGKESETETTNKRAETESISISTLPGLTTGETDDDLPSTKNPLVVRYEVNGKHKIYSRPQSLRISQGLQHLLTTLKLVDIQVSQSVLKRALTPCLSLQDLQLFNVSLTNFENNNNNNRPNNSGATDDDDEQVEIVSSVIFPKLKNYVCHCDSDDSITYSWEAIFFFSILDKLPSTLLTFWNSQTRIDVNSKSMLVQVNPDASIVFISLPKKEYYDAPHFVPYISKEAIREFFSKKNGKVESFTCLLPRDFDTVDFADLPNNVRNFRVSGLNISYSAGGGASVKFYKSAIFEKCSIPQSLFLDEISTAMPLARTVQLKECQIDSCEGADINIIMTC